MSIIENIHARQILDSRGNPTVEVEVFTANGGFGRAAVPSGASTGIHEAVELRDKDKSIFMGKGVLKAVDNVNGAIAEELIGFSVFEQNLIDKIMIELDGTDNKAKLGANAILGVSMACAKAAAQLSGQSLYRYIGGVNANTLPVPMMNILNGGSSHADNKIDFQEFMVMPVNAESFSEALRMGTTVFHHLKEVLKAKAYLPTLVMKVVFAPNIESNEQAIEVVLTAIEKAGYKPGEDIFIALDAAASEFYDEGKKKYVFESTGDELTSEEMVAYWKTWTDKYPILSIEDGMQEDDWEGWEKLTREIGRTVQLVGDDLFVTNTKRLQRGIDEKIANSILIKVNQIGTLTETINAIRMADKASYKNIISHRSGETEDTFIADLAVAMGSGQIKTGSASRSDRMAKYNQLLRIEEELGEMAYFPGINF